MREWTDTTRNALKVTVPEGELDGMHVIRFLVTGNGPAAFQHMLEGRPCEPGEYTKLGTEDCLWMSDTTAEQFDHWPAVQAIRLHHARRVLLNGLGLGMMLNAALTFDHVEHIDVVENDERVIKLVGPHYTSDPRVHIIQADAYEQMKRWPRGTTWDVGWSDIWPQISTQNLPGMARLNRSYSRRTQWHGCWCHTQCRHMQRQENW